MTHAMIYKSSQGELVGFKTIGHSGYADEGSDIVCAAISMLVINTINSLDQFTDADCEVITDEENAMISCMVQSCREVQKVQVLLQSLELGLNSVADSNPDYLLITVKEV